MIRSVFGREVGAWGDSKVAVAEEDEDDEPRSMCSACVIHTFGLALWIGSLIFLVSIDITPIKDASIPGCTRCREC